jgi:hypothetical protein
MINTTNNSNQPYFKLNQTDSIRYEENKRQIQVRPPQHLQQPKPHISKLPIELHAKILSFLDPTPANQKIKDDSRLLGLRRVCREWSTFKSEPDINRIISAAELRLINSIAAKRSGIVKNTAWSAAFGAGGVAAHFLNQAMREDPYTSGAISTLAAIGGYVMLNRPIPRYIKALTATLVLTLVGAGAVLAINPQGLIERTAEAAFKASQRGLFESGAAVLAAAGTFAGCAISAFGISMLSLAGRIDMSSTDQTFIQKTKSAAKLFLGFSAGTLAIGIGAGQLGSIFSTGEKLFSSFWNSNTENSAFEGIGTAAGILGAAALTGADQGLPTGLRFLTQAVGIGKGGTTPFLTVAANELLKAQNFSLKARQNICSGIIVGTATAIMGGLTPIAAFATSSIIAGCITRVLSTLRESEY